MTQGLACHTQGVHGLAPGQFPDEVLMHLVGKGLSHTVGARSALDLIGLDGPLQYPPGMAPADGTIALAAPKEIGRRV